MTTSHHVADQLVPLSDRQRALLVYRALLVATLLGVAIAAPGWSGLSMATLVELSAGYLAMAAGTHRLWRLPRPVALTIFGATLLVDGVFLAITTYGSSGLGTPLQYLVLIEVVTVTLLASFRTGLKVAIWNILLAATVFEFEQGGVLHPQQYPASRVAWGDLLVPAGLTLAVTIATATFASINERELRRRNYDLFALSQLAVRLEASMAPEHIAQAVIQTLHDDFDIGRSVIVGADEGGFRALGGRGAQPAPPGLSPNDDRLVRTVISRHEPARVRTLDPAREPWLASVLPGAANVIAVPFYANDTALGVVIAEHGSRPGSRIEQRTMAIIGRCVSHAGLALANAWLLETVRASAAIDPLTGVGNRRAFERALERELGRAERASAPLGCLMIDIDHFKLINDSFGHQSGDQILEAVAGVIVAECRASDVVARYGGEEFVVLMPGMQPAGGAETAERIRCAIAATTGATVSIGVAAFPATADAASLVHAADRALYNAKRSGRDRVVTAVRPAARPAPAPAGSPGPAPAPAGSAAGSPGAA